MKKIYVCPAINIEDATVESMLASSIFSDDPKIDFGGVDGDGDLNADVKEDSWGAWDDIDF